MEERSYPSLRRLGPVLSAPPITDALSRAVAAFEVEPEPAEFDAPMAEEERTERLPGAEGFAGGSVLDAWLAYGSFRLDDIAAVA